MASEATGRAVEFLVLAFATGLGLWCLSQLGFTPSRDGTADGGGSSDDGDGHHHGGWGDHAGDGGGYGGDAGGDGGGDGGH